MSAAIEPPVYLCERCGLEVDAPRVDDCTDCQLAAEMWHWHELHHQTNCLRPGPAGPTPHQRVSLLISLSILLCALLVIAHHLDWRAVVVGLLIGCVIWLLLEGVAWWQMKTEPLDAPNDHLASLGALAGQRTEGSSNGPCDS